MVVYIYNFDEEFAKKNSRKERRNKNKFLNGIDFTVFLRFLNIYMYIIMQKRKMYIRI